MFHIVLVSPEIPPNTGNVIRLAANTGAELHLVEPLGFALDDTRLRRAGLDYHEWARVKVHTNLSAALAATGGATDRCFAMTTRGARSFAGAVFQPGDVFVFGRETDGLSEQQLELFPGEQRVRLRRRPSPRSLD